MKLRRSREREREREIEREKRSQERKRERKERENVEEGLLVDSKVVFVLIKFLQRNESYQHFLQYLNFYLNSEVFQYLSIQREQIPRK